MDRIKAAVVQVCSDDDTERSCRRASELVRQAAEDGATLICVPENVGYLKIADRRDPGESTESSVIVGCFSELARSLDVSILVGSFHRKSDDATRAYNTSILLDNQGKVAGSYDKIHLFDIDLDPNTRFCESDDIVAGAETVVAKLGQTHIGLSVCYDLRFPELYRQLAADGAEIITIPAAFTERTGRDHWELLLRARAVENQCFVLAPDQWGYHGGNRHSYGHSMIIDPWGHVLARVGDGEGWASAWLEPDKLTSIRRNMPCIEHQRL